MLTEEQKKQLEDLQLYRNKEGSVSIEVSFSPPKSSSVLALNLKRVDVTLLFRFKL